MNFNTKEYEDSILKVIDTNFNKVAKELTQYTQIKNEDKTPEELFKELKAYRLQKSREEKMKPYYLYNHK